MRCKICPACGTQNAPSSMECDSCGYDLMGVPAVDPEEEKRKAEEQKQKEKDQLAPDAAADGQAADHGSVQNTGIVRVCPACGACAP